MNVPCDTSSNRQQSTHHRSARLKVLRSNRNHQSPAGAHRRFCWASSARNAQQAELDRQITLFESIQEGEDTS